MLKDKGFTLIELMVVVAIIGVLAAVLVPQIVNAIEMSKISRTTAELTIIKNAMNAYLADISSYPPSVQDFGRPWGADVGLSAKGQVVGSHQATWNGPYLEDWPQKTAWGPIVGCGAQGVYYIHYPIGWIDRNGNGTDDYWTHMNPYCGQYPPPMAIKIDRAMDDGNPGGGKMRLTGGWPEYIYSYIGEGQRSWW